MCGLIGIITGSNNKKYEDMFYQGLILDTIRGKHSTGATIVQNNDAMYHKNSIPGCDFVETTQFQNLLRNTALTRPTAFLGHNRSATMGRVNKANSHPFEIENIIGMHNGTMRRTSKLESVSFDTDSEAVFNHIQKHGVNDALNKAEGAYCLVWFDELHNKVFFVRNNERPMFFAKEKDTDTLFYGSEPEMLWWLASRNNVKIEDTYEIETEKLYSFDLDSNEVAKPHVKKLKIESEYPSYNNGLNQGYYGNAGTYNVNPNNGKNKNKNKNSQTNVNDQLKKLGLKKDDKIEVALFDHKCYTQHSVKGRIEAFSLESPFSTVIIHGVSEDEFADMEDVIQVSVNSVVDWNNKAAILCSLIKEYDNVQEVTSKGVGSTSQGEYQKGGNSQKKLNGPDYYKGPGDVYIEKDELEDKILQSHGCGMCGDDIYEEDYNHIEWHGEIPICPFCVEEWRFQFLG